MSQNRRDFIKNTMLFTLALGSPLVFSKTWLDTEKTDFSDLDLMGKSNPKLFGNGFNLRKETADSLAKLITEAKKNGFSPYVASSYRNYDHQKRIWDNKYVKFTQQQKLSPSQAIQKIILYSTIPGTSRHHWGTDFDIIDAAKGIVDNPLNEKHFNKNGVYHNFKLWMNENAESFGFYEVYTNDKNRKGFNYEPWHFSYLTTSCEMLREYINRNIISQIQSSNIKGSEYLTADFLNKYYSENIMDINKELIP